MAWKTMVTELLWFLRGDTNIKYLVDNGCHIWNGDAYKNFYKKSLEIKLAYESGDLLGSQPHIEAMFSNPNELIILSKEEFIEKIKTDDEFAKKWGNLGPVYGKQWRNWTPESEYVDGSNYVFYPKIDQIQNLIDDLKNNPDSRRLMVSAWNVGELDQMVLPPCHNFWQMYSVEKEGKRYLSIMINIRSNDIPLGLPFNIASYGLLLEIISRLVNMIPDELIINIGDAHIYLNQIEGIKEQLTREPYSLPKLVFNNQIHFSDNIDEFLNSCLITDFTIENYQFHPHIKLPLSN